MTYAIDRDGTKLTVTVEGSLDTLSTPRLEKELEPAMKGVTALVMDLKGLEYISSSGLRLLLELAKVMSKQGEMTVANVQEEVMHVFQLTRFTDFLHIV